ncbi:MAG: response regulator [Planctomycetota bacterium]
MTEFKPRPPVVLMVEDNPDDQDLARIANRQLARPRDLVVVDDGVEALDYLERAAGTTPGDARTPDLLLVDLAMPRMDGQTLLKYIRSHAKLCRIPVVMFTTSTADADVRRCYELGCNSYIVKPMSIHSLRDLLGTLNSYWFGCVRLPAS